MKQIKSELITSNNKLFARFLEYYFLINKRYHDKNKKVLISGMPRGGTTWLAELLLNINNSILFWEPLRPFRLEEQNLSEFSKELGWFPYIPENGEWYKGHRF